MKNNTEKNRKQLYMPLAKKYLSRYQLKVVKRRAEEERKERGARLTDEGGRSTLSASIPLEVDF